MTAAQEIDRIVDRIKKLLALATSQNPHEAGVGGGESPGTPLPPITSAWRWVEAATESGTNGDYVSGSLR